MRLGLLVLACLLVVGCVRTNVQRLDQLVRPIRSPDSVAVLVERPRQPYTVIATIKARGETVFDSFGKMRREMLAHAAEIGGDALVFGPESTTSTFIITPFALVKSDRKRLSGEVIVFDRRPR